MNIEYKLNALHVPPHFKGFALLKRAVELQVEDSSMAQDIWTKLYPRLAEEFHTNPICVERNIRHAIARAEKYTPFGAEHMTNAHFIADTALKFKLELERKKQN